MQVVLEEGLNISSLPETIKEDFEKLNRFEGEYRVTSMLVEAVDSDDLSPRKGPSCSFCNVKAVAEKMEETVRQELMITVSKVILCM